MVEENRGHSRVRVLWANRPGELLTDELIACFPSVESEAYSLSPSELDLLMTGLSPRYATVLEVLSRLVAIEIGADRETSRIILRESVVLITYVLLDRILRLNKILTREGEAGLVVAAQNGISLPKTNAQLIGLVDGSQEFNQHLIWRLTSSIWQLNTVKLERSPLSDVRNPTPTGNLNFDHPGLLTRIKRKVSVMLSASLGRIPVLRLANIEAALLDKGLYGVGKLRRVHPLPANRAPDRNYSLRQRLLPQLSEELGAVMCNDLFRKEIGLGECEAKRATQLFCELR